MTEIEKVLEERKKTHGEYSDHAMYAQAIKAVITKARLDRKRRGQTPLSAIMIESLEMNAHKIGRILAGDPTVNDHWDDIAGYAKLVSERLTTEVVAEKTNLEENFYEGDEK